ncbi:hypothetical protein SNEBB_002504 [Seison nebaliae]|nr:hypothetical protein SNEBB_002504 [Seison nebaliae]
MLQVNKKSFGILIRNMKELENIDGLMSSEHCDNAFNQNISNMMKHILHPSLNRYHATSLSSFSQSSSSSSSSSFSSSSSTTTTSIIKIFKISLYILIITLAILGNVAILIVIPKLSLNRANIFLMNLAVCDIIITLFCTWVYIYTDIQRLKLFQPQDSKILAYRQYLGSFVCRFNQFAQIASVNAAMGTLVAISIERFMGLVFTFRAFQQSENIFRRFLSRPITLIVFIWIFSLLMGLPMIFVSKPKVNEWNDVVEYSCETDWPTMYIYYKRTYPYCNQAGIQYSPNRKIFYTTITLLLFFIPMLLMSIFYGFIIRKLMLNSSPSDKTTFLSIPTPTTQQFSTNSCHSFCNTALNRLSIIKRKKTNCDEDGKKTINNPINNQINSYQHYKSNLNAFNMKKPQKSVPIENEVRSCPNYPISDEETIRHREEQLAVYFDSEESLRGKKFRIHTGKLRKDKIWRKITRHTTPTLSSSKTNSEWNNDVRTSTKFSLLPLSSVLTFNDNDTALRNVKPKSILFETKSQDPKLGEKHCSYHKNNVIRQCATLPIPQKLPCPQVKSEDQTLRRHGMRTVRSRRKAFILLFSILVTFCCCWSPLQAQLLYTAYKDNNTRLPNWMESFSFFAYTLAYMNTVLNPILYTGLNKNFRQKLFVTIKKIFQVKPLSSAHSFAMLKLLYFPLINLVGNVISKENIDISQNILNDLVISAKTKREHAEALEREAVELAARYNVPIKDEMSRNLIENSSNMKSLKVLVGQDVIMHTSPKKESIKQKPPQIKKTKNTSEKDVEKLKDLFKKNKNVIYSLLDEKKSKNSELKKNKPKNLRHVVEKKMKKKQSKVIPVVEDDKNVTVLEIKGPEQTTENQKWTVDESLMKSNSELKSPSTYQEVY